MLNRSHSLCLYPLLLLPVVAAIALGEDAYVKKDTLLSTMLASREKFQQQHAGKPVPLSLGSWYCTDTMTGKDFTQSFFPEEGVDLQAKDDGGKARWTEKADWKDKEVQELPSRASAATYLFRTINVSKPVKVTAALGCDGGIMVWLNDKQMLSKAVASGAGPREEVQFDLIEGENRLLIKTFNHGGEHAFYFSDSVPPSVTSWRVWDRIRWDFRADTDLLARDISHEKLAEWIRTDDTASLEKWAATQIADKLAPFGDDLRQELKGLYSAQTPPDTSRWLEFCMKAQRRAVEYVSVRPIPGKIDEIGPAANALGREYEDLVQANTSPKNPAWQDLSSRVDNLQRQFASARDSVSRFSVEAIRLAVKDLTASFPDSYKDGSQYLKQLDAVEANLPGVADGLKRGDPGAVEEFNKLLDQQRAALLSNPLLDFEKLLIIRRGAKSPVLGLPQNWLGNCAIPRGNFYDDDIAILSPIRGEAGLTTLFRPEEKLFVGDLDLHFDADRMLFSMLDKENRWQIWEIKSDGTGLRQVTPGEHPDVDNYDACYLPSGKIIFGSTRCFQGVPCIGGGARIANLCIMDADGKNIRQLCFDQDHNWCPTVLNDGRILYTRWEYSDTPHYFARLLFRMNPDGTGQMEYYGSNSYWPNSMFYARPIPGDPSKVVAIISGHHYIPRMGELVILDPAKSRFEADGAVQRIPGYGKDVPPVILDRLVAGSWPKFLHPYPLNDKYFLIASQPNHKSLWGIYLVDVFDNMVLLHEQPGYALLEPVPFRKTTRPPVIPDRIKPDQKDAVVFLPNVYVGDGLKGVPRGTVKKLRIYEVHYAYPGMGGPGVIGIDGPWDVRRIHGTVPVHEDGSALFKVPANTPLAVQPLDAEGKALQVMRSWFTAMPGEYLSCVGCHERQNTVPPSAGAMALQTAPVEITPWYGPPRGLSFKREVQPVLDKHCVSCHDGESKTKDEPLPNFADTSRGWPRSAAQRLSSGVDGFTKSYMALHPYVRRPGPESDYHLQKPMEWHADTSELIQMLKKGHYNVKLDAEGWDRIITWIDLNVPDHGTWTEHRKISANFHERRLDMRTLYANRPEDPEAIIEPEPYSPAEAVAVASKRNPEHGADLECDGWPFDAAEAKKRVSESGLDPELSFDLGDGVTLDLVLIPAGSFVMGDSAGCADEHPRSVVRIEKPFYMAKFEVTNEQYGRFDRSHDSGVISRYSKDQNTRGADASGERQPVIRVTWRRAMDFCKWLSERTGRKFSLPTESEWEWACRAGSDTPMSYGSCDTDFGELANFADERLNDLAPPPGYGSRLFSKWIPSVKSVNDGAIVTEPGERYRPNPWNLYNMHGNVAEWTLSAYEPYPYKPGDGRNEDSSGKLKVVRGGSFYDRPERGRSAFRLAYQPWQAVFNVGFRVISDVEPDAPDGLTGNEGMRIVGKLENRNR